MSARTTSAPLCVQEVRALNLVAYAKANLADAERNVELARLALDGAEAALAAVQGERDARTIQQL